MHSSTPARRQYFIVPETQNPISLRFKEKGSQTVILDHGGVLAAVDFDDDPGRVADEIREYGPSGTCLRQWCSGNPSRRARQRMRSGLVIRFRNRRPWSIASRVSESLFKPSPLWGGLGGGAEPAA